jgi:Zn-dependent peptidase ImmA (M78 family)
VSVREYVQRELAVTHVTSMDYVRSIASYFRVSLRAVAVRLIELSLADGSLYGTVNRIAEFRGPPPRKRQGGSPPRPIKRLREWGPLYARRLTEAERRGQLTRYDVMEYLNVSDQELATLQNELRSFSRGS